MADASNSSLKRPHPEDEDSSGQKRVRSNNGSPRPSTPTAGGTPAPNISDALAKARARAAELRARVGAAAAKPASPVSIAPAAAAAPQSAADRLAAMKARVAAATSKATTTTTQRTSGPPPKPQYEDMPQGRFGLDVGLHPLLRDDEPKTTTGRAQPKFPSAMGNRKAQQVPKKEQLDLSGPNMEEIKANPFFDVALGTTSVRNRHSRQLIFNQKGKYIEQAANLRRQAKLEEMKKRIAAHARLAGIDEDLDTEKAFIVAAPPEIEWWDEGLVEGESYTAITNPANLKIDTPDSIITVYIQHPVLLEPPQEKHMPAPKAMYLTKTEQAKLRRQRRKADLQEQQAKVRLGLEPPPPPKVKKNNMMRVLGNEAVQDPTAVEARVNREIAERAQKHEEMNAGRALTKEQKAEKLLRQQEADEAMGIQVRVYKVASLANGKHRFQITKNAEQNKLTGVCIMHPRLNVIVVEGGAHSIRNYDKLMLNRIHWTENEEPKAVQEGNREAQAKWLESKDDETGELKDLSENRCELIFSGEEKQRNFRKWLGARVCETDSQARDVLSRAKMADMWAQAKSWKTDVY
jgi:U4/U6 small nuclear ribonucleoprotein PRP3